MSLKKSAFGELCHKHRGKMTEQEMSKTFIEDDIGYKLGKKPAKSKQSLISQFEREFDPEGAIRKQHRDPPLEYVEACAKLFELPLSEKYDLFVSALQSSENIVFDKNNIEGHIKREIIEIILSLILSGRKLGNIIKKHQENKRKSLSYTSPNNDTDMQFIFAWEQLLKASQDMINVVKRNDFKYIKDTK
jgi:hypothetical protein